MSWCIAALGDLLDYEQPTNYIVESTDYNDSFKTPVLTAGKSFLLGYTNESHGIYRDLPVIIFDDFTTAIKFVTFPFKVKSSAMKILKPKHKEINIKYVYYFMETMRLSADTHKRYWISVGALHPIPLAPLAEQNRIIAKIEELFSELDKSIESLKTAQQQLKVYRQAVLKYAFEGRLTNPNVKDGELPEGWVLKPLGQVGKWSGGGTPSRSNPEFWEGGTIDWITSKDMKSDVILSSEDKITPEAIGNSSAKLIPCNSVLIVMRSGILRRTLPISLVTHEVTINQDLQACTPKEIDSKYLFYALRAFAETIRKTCSKDGTTVESIDSTALKRFEIPIASPIEQHQIVTQIEHRLEVSDKIEESVEAALQRAEALRQSVLKKAFEGKLVQQDPSDEPASVLLQRIKAEKARQTTAKKSRNKKATVENEH